MTKRQQLVRNFLEAAGALADDFPKYIPSITSTAAGDVIIIDDKGFVTVESLPRDEN